jgi:hypothetical protein
MAGDRRGDRDIFGLAIAVTAVTMEGRLLSAIRAGLTHFTTSRVPATPEANPATPTGPESRMQKP